MKDVSVYRGCSCKECGEIIIFQANNTQIARFEGWDWFVYCANKECENHVGEGIFQDTPAWVFIK